MKNIKILILIIFILISIFINSCNIEKTSENKNETDNNYINSEAAIPPNRGIGGKEIAHFDPSDIMTVYNDYDITARIRIGKYLGEEFTNTDLETGFSFYEANVIETYRGNMPNTFKFCQGGTSKCSYSNTTLVSYGNEVLVFLKYSEKHTGYIAYTHGIFDIATVNNESYIVTTYPNYLTFSINNDILGLDEDNIISDSLISSVKKAIEENDQYWKANSYPKIDGIYKLDTVVEQLLTVDN